MLAMTLKDHDKYNPGMENLPPPPPHTHTHTHTPTLSVLLVPRYILPRTGCNFLKF